MQYHESAKPIGAHGEHLQLLRLRGVQGVLFAWPGRRLLLLGLMADREALAIPGAAPRGAAATGVLPTGTSSAASRAVAPGGAPAAAGAAAGAATAPGVLDFSTGAAIGTTGAAAAGAAAAAGGFPGAQWGLGGGLLCLVRHVWFKEERNPGRKAESITGPAARRCCGRGNCIYGNARRPLSSAAWARLDALSDWIGKSAQLGLLGLVLLEKSCVSPAKVFTKF